VDEGAASLLKAARAQADAAPLPRRPKPKQKRRVISVRGLTYQRIQEAAGESSVSGWVEKLIAEKLGEK
jgi:hypothetical protein